MTEDEKNIVAFVEGKKGLISPLYEVKKSYKPDDEPGPGDVEITLRIPVKNGEHDDWFNLILLHREGGCVDGLAEVEGIRLVDANGHLSPFSESSTFLNMGQEKSAPFREWLKDVFFEWYYDWERDYLQSRRELHEKEKAERFAWRPSEKDRALLASLVKGLS